MLPLKNAAGFLKSGAIWLDDRLELKIKEACVGF